MPKYMLVCLLAFMSCSKKDNGQTPVTPPNPPAPSNDVSAWITTPDQSMLLLQQSSVLTFDTKSNSYPTIEVDSTTKYQMVDGFGYTLTGGSATLINQLNPTNKATLLQELFGKDASSISVSYLRLSIGASDLNSTVFSYDDMPAGQTDVPLDHFTLGPDTVDLIPVLKQILAINPSIKIITAPWSAPVWMKDKNSTIGGSLLPQYYAAYAAYFVRYIQAMKAQGITIDAVTPQNEPLNPANNPSLYMEAPDQATFIKNNLGPAFLTAGLTTKIVVYDHNCDVPQYATSILSDPAAAAFVDGSAFHLYAGSINALTAIHVDYPTKNLYFTEQYTASTSDFAGDLKWHMTNVIIGSMSNWSRNALEWNLANDPSFGPHTPGGCTTCKGALTIAGSTVTRNVGYYIIAHASKFVPAGSVRISSSVNSTIANVAFLTPAGKKVLLAENNGTSTTAFNIRFKGKWVSVFLPAGAAASYVW